MSEIHVSELYLAATNSLASEASATNTYEKMVASAMVYSDIKEFKAKVKHIEDIIKDEFSLTSMPNPWRSAKSVCYTAMSLGIPFLDDNCVVKGKSQLQFEIKEHKRVASDVELTPFDKARKGLDIIVRHFNDLTTVEQASLKAIIAGLW